MSSSSLVPNAAPSPARPGVGRVLAAGAAGAAPAAWQPAAWGDVPAAAAAVYAAPVYEAFEPGFAGVLGGGVENGGRSVARAEAGAHLALPFLDALPEFCHEATDDADALARACAEAADAREAELRAEFEAAWVAEADALAARGAADAEAAYAAGVADGRAAGAADARAELAAAADTLAAAAAEVHAHAARWAADLEAHVAALAVAVAHHVIGRTAARDAAIVTDLVARALAEFPADQALAARVHPDDVPALKAAWAAAPRAAELRWIPDAGVARGGALVEGRERIVDGRVDTALERIYRTLSGHQA